MSMNRIERLSREKTLAATGLFALLSGCSSAPAIVTPTKFCMPNKAGGPGSPETALRIVGGRQTGNGDPMERSTVALQVIYDLADGSGKKLASTCTAVVAARNIVITAAHCFNKPQQPVSKTAAAVTTNPSLLDANSSDLIGLVRAVQHPDYNGIFHDIAIAQLQSDLPVQAVTASFVADVSTLTKSLPVVLIGYGITSDKSDDSGTKRRTESMLDMVINQQNFPLTNIVNQIRVLDSSGLIRGACHGDSGGPGFVKQSGQVFGVVQGINSTVQPPQNMNCSSGDANYTLIAPYQAWIEQTANIKLNTSIVSLTSQIDANQKSGNITAQNSINATAQVGSKTLTGCE